MPKPDDYEFPPDATPLRKISAAVAWGDPELVLAYVKEALDAGIPRRYVDLASGRRRWDLIEWQEAITYLNHEERAEAMRSIHDWIQKSGEPLEHKARRRALRAALVEGEESGAPEPFDFDDFADEKRKEAGDQLDALLQISESELDEMVEDFNQRRRTANRSTLDER